MFILALLILRLPTATGHPRLGLFYFFFLLPSRPPSFSLPSLQTRTSLHLFASEAAAARFSYRPFNTNSFVSLASSTAFKMREIVSPDGFPLPSPHLESWALGAFPHAPTAVPRAPELQLWWLGLRNQDVLAPEMRLQADS